MSEPLYSARATIETVGAHHRRARLATGQAVDFGVHGPIRSHFRIDAERELPLPVDYIVAATGG